MKALLRRIDRLIETAVVKRRIDSRDILAKFSDEQLAVYVAKLQAALTGEGLPACLPAERSEK